MDSLTIRSLTRDDIRIATLIADENHYDRQVCKNDLEDMFSDSNERPIYLVAVLEQKVVGFIGYRSMYMTDNCRNIFWLMVDKDHQRNGIGTRLMNEAMTRIEETTENLEKIFLVAYIPDYYKKFGFKPIHDITKRKVMMARDVHPRN